MKRIALLAALLLAAPSLRAQATLDQVETLIAEGRTEAARDALVSWMEAAAPKRGGSAGARGTATRNDAQRALWLRAVLTVDPALAAVDYQRLVVEYPGGPYADRALLRLAQTAEAQGNVARARELVETLARDYPGGSARLEGARLLERLGSAPPTTPPAAPVVPPPSAGEAGRWTVQLGAFASPESARALRDEMASGGVAARVVQLPGSRLIHVRAGRFATQSEADGLRAALSARGVEATVAGDADREETTR